MKRIIILLLFFASPPLNSQTTMKGVLLKSKYGFASKSDTITVKGVKSDTKTGSSIYIVHNSKSNYDYELKSDKVRLINQDIGFWQRIWFEHCGYEINTKGWDIVNRRKLDQLTLQNIALLDSKGQLFDDRFIQDYLQSLIIKIHPEEIKKETNHSFGVYIMNSDSAAVYACDNGIILITTQMIAGTSSEEELLNVLIYAVAATITDLQFNNYRKIINSNTLSGVPLYDEDIHAIQLACVPYQNDVKFKKIVDAYLKELILENKSVLCKDEYLSKISYIVSYTAWQEYFNQHYSDALKLINLLSEHNIVTNEDLLLKSKIFLAREDTPESNRQALGFLEEAEKTGPYVLTDIYKEKGIVLLRLNQPEEALKAFNKLEEILHEENDGSNQLKWCRYMIHKCQLLINN